MKNSTDNVTTLAPSLLAGDHALLAHSAKQIADAGIKWAHLDIMDGHFVPNLTFGPQMLAALRKHEGGLFYDVHLMLDNPAKFIEPFAKAGAGLISIHIEPEYDHAAELARIRSLGAKCGIVLNPATPANAILPVLDKVDLVLVMTVQPGYGGQPFRSEMLTKIEQIAEWRRAHNANFLIEVDGGIDLKTAPECIKAGADVLVSGTSFFKATDKKAFSMKILARETN